MAQLAIKGHATRGKEVIEILEMLGGVNQYEMPTAKVDLLYTIRRHDKFIIAVYPTDTFIVFTLEEFLEKFPYKVGDKVIVSETQKEVIIEHMSWRDNKIIYKTCYNDDCVAYYIANDLQPYKEKLMEEIKIGIPNGYEFSGINVDKQQVVFEKIGCQYPKTYEECCDVLSRFTEYDLNKKRELLLNVNKLLICRDAYWKIAGEQMGLGKPWEPDWINAVYTYTIICRSNKVVKDGVFDADNRILAFPTKEMRDTFYDNFKELIEQCKELL